MLYIYTYMYIYTLSLYEIYLPMWGTYNWLLCHHHGRHRTTSFWVEQLVVGVKCIEKFLRAPYARNKCICARYMQFLLLLLISLLQIFHETLYFIATVINMKSNLLPKFSGFAISLLILKKLPHQKVYNAGKLYLSSAIEMLWSHGSRKSKQSMLHG